MRIANEDVCPRLGSQLLFLGQSCRLRPLPLFFRLPCCLGPLPLFRRQPRSLGPLPLLLGLPRRVGRLLLLGLPCRPGAPPLLLLRLPRCFGLWIKREELPIGRAQVEDRGAPFDIVAGRKNRSTGSG